MGYNGSLTHLENLAHARIIAATPSVLCQHCGVLFSKAGVKAHSLACSQGKNCPVCGSWFFGDGVTCSHGCANTYFRTGPQHGNWKEDAYRTTCFHFHRKQCVICGEQNLVEVHHLDEDKTNNNPKNLVPLCPTHHQYWHSAFRNLVEPKILSYMAQWGLTALTGGTTT